MLRLKNGNFVGRHFSGRLVEVVGSYEYLRAGMLHRVPMDRATTLEVRGLDDWKSTGFIDRDKIDLEV